MNKKVIVSTLAALILLIYIGAIVIVDPYNYFNTHIIDDDIKERIAFPIDERLSKIIEYDQNPSSNVLIGDSRIQNLSTESIKQFTGVEYYNFGFGGCTLPELINSFWFVAERAELDNVIMGVSFDMYNRYNNTDLFSPALRSSKLFYYIFNVRNIKVLYYMTIDHFSKEKTDLSIPDISDMDLFWTKTMDEQTSKFYASYSYPETMYKSLVEIANYCKANNIRLSFFIPPTHIELQNKISDFSLEQEYSRFLSDFEYLGHVYDFNYDTEFTRNRSNFFDPFHFRRDLDTLIIKVLVDESIETVDTTVFR